MIRNQNSGDSRFNNNYFERKLKVTATTRNFNTMTKLVKLGKRREVYSFKTYA